MFSGIAAPEVSSPNIEWKWRAEIEKFPNAVTRRRFKGIPNLGDVTDETFIERAKEQGPIDVLVFGSPCQSYSVAGKRLGLDDPRGNLALVALGIIGALRPGWFVFENVPGLFSSWSGGPLSPPEVADGHEGYTDREFRESSDFASFLSAVRECGYFGSWATLDSQFFGVPQRRRRIFFVGHSGDWRYPAAVLFEPESMSRHFAPRRKAGEGVTHDIAGSLTSSGRGVERPGDSRGQDPVVAVASTLKSNNGGGGFGSDPNETFIAAPLTGNPYADNESHESKLVAMCLNAKNNRFDGESQTFVTHSLRADGFEASEDGTGRGTPLIPVPILEAGARTGKSTTDARAGMGIGTAGDPMFTLQSGKQHAIGFYGNDSGHDAQEGLAPTLRSMPGGGGNHPAVAFQEAQTGVREYPESGTLRSNGPGHDPVGTRIRQGMAVRRLTPIECARLQGFPNTFCHIYRNKRRKITEATAMYYRSHGLKCFLRDGQWYTLVAADGPIYKAYGNSMSIPVIGWILSRIQIMETAILKSLE